jgi:hypothetical protein
MVYRCASFASAITGQQRTFLYSEFAPRFLIRL